MALVFQAEGKPAIQVMDTVRPFRDRDKAATIALRTKDGISPRVSGSDIFTQAARETMALNRRDAIAANLHAEEMFRVKVLATLTLAARDAGSYRT